MPRTDHNRDCIATLRYLAAVLSDGTPEERQRSAELAEEADTLELYAYCEEIGA